jgi:hypothetical protein
LDPAAVSALAGTGAGGAAGVVAFFGAGAGELAATALSGEAGALAERDGPGDAAADAGGAAGELPLAGAGETVGDEDGFVLGAGAGVGEASSAGARFPMFDRSGPNLILPSIAGRSKM